MIKRIVLGLTGSNLSQAAAETAITWARLYDIEIVAIAVIDIDRLTGAEAVPIGGSGFKSDRDAHVLREAHAEADKWLVNLAELTKSRHVSCQTRRRDGDPAKILLEESQRGDLLLIGCTGPHNGAKQSFDFETLLRSATRPIVIAPANGIAAAASVLVAYDGSPECARSLQMFTSLGLASNRVVHLLSVSDEEEVRASVDLAADYLRLHGQQVQVHKKCVRGPTGEAILSEADRCGAGVIVMGAYGRGRVAELLLGSVTKHVISHTHVPLFLYH
jgi:nucleotide-binding universal stress UspA family protein